MPSRWSFTVPRDGEEPLLRVPDDGSLYVQFRLCRHANDRQRWGDYLFVGPNWKGNRARRSIDQGLPFRDPVREHRVGRTQLFNPADLDNVKKIQAGYKVRRCRHTSATAPARRRQSTGSSRCRSGRSRRTSLEFFDQPRVSAAVRRTAPSQRGLRLRKPLRSASASCPASRFDVASLSTPIESSARSRHGGRTEGDRRPACRRSAERARISSATRALSARTITSARATGTQVGIGANSKERGALSDLREGCARQATLRNATTATSCAFADGTCFPPVNAFWSLTMYDVPGQLLVKNPINRYLINSPMLPGLKRDTDGGLTILHPERFPRSRQGSELATRAQGPVHYGRPLLLAEARVACRANGTMLPVSSAAPKFQLSASKG